MMPYETGIPIVGHLNCLNLSLLATHRRTANEVHKEIKNNI